MVTIQVGSCALTGIGIHNGQGLGTYDVDSKESGKKISKQVVGSEWLPSIPILLRDVVQLGRTLALGARGRWFKSSHSDNIRGLRP